MIRYYGQLPEKVELDGNGVLVHEAPSSDSPFDFQRWKESPHVALANLQGDPKALLAFTRRYGRVFERPASSGIVSALPRDAVRFRNYLRQAWEGDENVLAQMLIDLKVSVHVQKTGLDIVVSDLWTLTRLMFLQDWRAGRTRVCASPDCPAPYFLAVRKGQRFCSQRCAVLVNVRRFRERQAKQQALKSKRGTRRGEYAKATKA